MIMKNSRAKKQSGFTLIELMVTIVILGIILAIAVPSYRGHVMKAKRVEAFTALTHIASLEEQYFSENRSYTELPDDLGLPVLSGSSRQTPVDNDNYKIWMGLNANQGGFALVATAINGQAEDKYKRFRIFANGKKQYSLVKSGNDWVDNWPE